MDTDVSASLSWQELEGEADLNWSQAFWLATREDRKQARDLASCLIEQALSRALAARASPLDVARLHRKIARSFRFARDRPSAREHLGKASACLQMLAKRRKGATLEKAHIATEKAFCYFDEGFLQSDDRAIRVGLMLSEEVVQMCTTPPLSEGFAGCWLILGHAYNLMAVGYQQLKTVLADPLRRT